MNFPPLLSSYNISDARPGGDTGVDCLTLREIKLYQDRYKVSAFFKERMKKILSSIDFADIRSFSDADSVASISSIDMHSLGLRRSPSCDDIFLANRIKGMGKAELPSSMRRTASFDDLHFEFSYPVIGYG